MDEPSFSTPAFGYVLKIVTNRSDCGKGSGRSRMELITAKIARFAPRQSATVASAVTVNAGDLRNCRSAKRRSVIGLLFDVAAAVSAAGRQIKRIHASGGRHARL